MSIYEKDLSTDDARVYVGRNAGDIPPHPGHQWTRFVCVSDTHSRIISIPAGDVLLHAGDIVRGELQDFGRMIEWLKTLPHDKKVIIAGNHDLCLDVDLQPGGLKEESGFSKEQHEQARSVVRSAQDVGIHYLEHESIELEVKGKVWKIYGSPSTTRYRYTVGSFQYESETEGQAIYSRIPSDTEILMTHSPPYRTLDKTRKGPHAGCKMLANKIRELPRCKLHVWGHIHEAYGARISQDRVSVNAAIVHSGRAIVVDIAK